MKKWIQAAYGTHTGRIRKNNEDNVCFDGCFLDADHGAASRQTTLRGGTGRFAVFDGMGGENNGELASYAAAKAMAAMCNTMTTPAAWTLFICTMATMMKRPVMQHWPGMRKAMST